MSSRREERERRKRERADRARQRASPLPGAPAPGDAPSTLASANEERAVLSFRHSNPGGKYCLSRFGDRSLREACKQLSRLTGLTWAEIRGDTSLKLRDSGGWSHLMGNPQRPEGVPVNAQLWKFNAGQKGRFYGYRDGRVFEVVLADDGHRLQS